MYLVKLTSGYKDGTRLFINRAGGDPVEFKPPLFELSELTLQAGERVHLKGSGPSAERLVARAKVFLETSEGGSDGGSKNSGGVASASDPSGGGVSLSSASFYNGIIEYDDSISNARGELPPVISASQAFVAEPNVAFDETLQSARDACATAIASLSIYTAAKG